MKSKLSIEILKIILIALLISIFLNLSLNYVAGSYFDDLAIQNRMKFHELQNEGVVQLRFSDYMDDEGDVYELVINLSIIFIFSSIIYYFINKKVKYITEISNGLESIGGGDLEYHIHEKGKNEITDLAKSINRMSEALRMHIKEERIMFESKQQLITGISHDLRAPLSAIIGYLYVLSDKQYKYDTERDEYVEITLAKSLRLQELLDNLLEMATLQEKEKVIKTSITPITILKEEFMAYLHSEIESHCSNVETIQLKLNQKIDVKSVELNKMYTLRVLDNLVSNIGKYALVKSGVEVEIREQKKYIELVVSNLCDEETLNNADKLIERFYMIDQSRTREDSSGLGLNICKEIMYKQNGYLNIEAIKDKKQISIILGFKKS